MRTKFYLPILLFGLFSGCGGSDSATTTDTMGITLSGTSKKGLLLTTTQDYKSSRLFWFDFATESKSEVFAGESGDPALFAAGTGVFFFNRTSDNSNLRQLTRTSAGWDIGAQTAMPGAGSGDPQSVLALDDRFLLLSFWSANGLGLFDRQEGKLTQTVTFPFDTGSGDTHVFRPSSLFRSAAGGIYVVHQGLASDGLTLTGQQQIFVLTWDGSTLGADDRDPAKEKIQGIPLKVSNPTNVFPAADGSVMVAGSCTIYGGDSCKSGFEQVDLVTGTTALVWDMSDLPEKHNGAIVAAGTDVYYAQMLKPGADQSVENGEKHVVRLDLQGKTMTKIHNYPAESNGCCGLFYDETSQKLIVTDHTPAADGSVSVLDSAGTVLSTATVANTPYNGLIVAQ
jgi:hypothetical protein